MQRRELLDKLEKFRDKLENLPDSMPKEVQDASNKLVCAIDSVNEVLGAHTTLDEVRSNLQEAIASCNSAIIKTSSNYLLLTRNELVILLDSLDPDLPKNAPLIEELDAFRRARHELASDHKITTFQNQQEILAQEQKKLFRFGGLTNEICDIKEASYVGSYEQIKQALRKKEEACEKEEADEKMAAQQQTAQQPSSLVAQLWKECVEKRRPEHSAASSSSSAAASEDEKHRYNRLS